MGCNNVIRILIKRLFQRRATWEELCQVANEESVEKKMKQQWNAISVYLSEDRKETENKLWKNIQQRVFEDKKASRKIQFWRYAVAACIVSCVIGYLHWNEHRNLLEENITYIDVFASHDRMFFLPDSSKVWMKAGSSVHYANNFKAHRIVKLNGESAFEVMKQVEHPFRVYVGQAFVEVKGTAFNVFDNENGEVEVTLYRGKVGFNIPHSEKEIEMKPGQRLIYHPDSGFAELKSIVPIDWKQGTYKFVEKPLLELFQNMEDMYHIHIEVEKDVPIHFHFTGTIRYDEQLMEVFDKICFNAGLKVIRMNGKYIVCKK